MALRALSRLRRGAPQTQTPEWPDGDVGGWLEQIAGPELERIDAACADGSPEHFALFRQLDSRVWGTLLTQRYDSYPHIRALLPDVPDPELQALYNGTSDVPLAVQSEAFYSLARERFEELDSARLLDFGCGWGRLTRYFARDVQPGSLYGCDPVEDVLDVCRRTRVPAELARSEFLPERLPFDQSFDLAFSFSVFTHISEQAARRCLEALHAGMRPGGVLIVTVRPPEYAELNELMQPVRGELDPERPQHLFVPHAADPSHPQFGGDEMHFGEAVVTLPYVRERWSDLFELLETDGLAADAYQTVLTLRRR
jgi:SAM-dependent methyltransferase